MFLRNLLRPRAKLQIKLCRLIHLEYSPNTKLESTIYDRYTSLPLPDCKIMLKYLWIDGTGEHLRSKTRTLDYIPCSHKDCPNWTFNGAGTNQMSKGTKSDFHLVPIAIYKDPIRKGNNKIVLCECYDAENQPTQTNHRISCTQCLNDFCDKGPIFGMEQEFFFTDFDGRPFGWPKGMGEPNPNGDYYCCIGATRVYGREIIEAIYRCCLYCGIDVYGSCAEQNLSQWEFKTGPTRGIKACDDLWMLRYLINRVAEDYGVGVTFHPKLFPNWDGSACHTTFSCKEMMEDGGIKAIEKAICKLEKKHSDFLHICDPNGGKETKARLKQLFDKFSSGIGERNCCIRIPTEVSCQKKGYFEDRRPSANMDPYQVVSFLARTVFSD